MPKFDPSSYLTSQGWEGKGKALQQGHATRPIAVVQKKTLAGVGKDRDEATPFWDHIFATTAIQIKIPSASVSGAATPTGTATATPGPSGTSTPQTASSPLPNTTSSEKRTYIPPTAYGRTKQQLARVSLYSKFTKGAVVVHDVNQDEEEKMTGDEKQEVVASSSRVTLDSKSSTPSGASTPLDEGNQVREKISRKVERGDEVREKEVKKREKEERRARRDAKKEKKGKGKGRESEVDGVDGKDDLEVVESPTERTNADRKKNQNSKEQNVLLNGEDDESTSGRKKKRRRNENNSIVASEIEVDGSSTLSEKEEKRERKKKRKEAMVPVVPVMES